MRPSQNSQRFFGNLYPAYASGIATRTPNQTKLHDAKGLVCAVRTNRIVFTQLALQE